MKAHHLSRPILPAILKQANVCRSLVSFAIRHSAKPRDHTPVKACERLVEEQFDDLTAVEEKRDPAIAGVNEAAESVADNQAMRILDQEIRDAEQSLRQARSDLAGIIASNKSVARRLDENRAKETKDSDSARSAVSAGRIDLAQGLAQRIADPQRSSARSGRT